MDVVYHKVSVGAIHNEMINIVIVRSMILLENRIVM